MPLAVTPIYAAVLAVVFVALSLRVIFQRQRAKVSLGDGGDQRLLRRQRVQGNFAEYAPFALLLMALAEWQGVPAWSLHLIGVALVAGRLLHAYGVNQEAEKLQFRGAGMMLTFFALISGAIANLAPLVLRG